MLLLAAGLVWTVPLLRPQADARPDAAAATGDAWQPWSPERVTQAQAAGRAVFVDFTAAWCVTCQFNKRSTLSRADVLAAFSARHVVLLRADWTRRDPAISAELARLQRSGVPVYALYAPSAAARMPRLLTEILSVGEVLEALAALPG